MRQAAVSKEELRVSIFDARFPPFLIVNQPRLRSIWPLTISSGATDRFRQYYVFARRDSARLPFGKKRKQVRREEGCLEGLG